MRSRETAPWWLAAAVTAIPILLAALLVAAFPPGPRKTSAVVPVELSAR